MYNINSHYQLVYELAFDKNKHRLNHPALLYLFPFGSTSIDNVEFLYQNKIGGNKPEFVIIGYDQEPLNFDYNKHLFDQITSFYLQNKFFNQFDEEKVYSTNHKSFINFVSSERYQSYVVNKTARITKLTEQSVPYILLNTEKDSEEKNKILNHYNFIDCYYFFHGLAAADWYRGNQYSQQIVQPHKRQIDKKYITFNRITGNARVYRSFFISELYQKKLLDHGHVSYSKICPVHGDYKTSILSAQTKYCINSNYVQSVLKNLNEISDSLRIDTPHFQDIDNGSYTVGPIDKINNSFMYIVTETCFWDRKKHLTEKIFKPIASKMPFVLLGCANNLKYLKEYGFRTFDRWWDESYDDIEDPLTRLQAVVNIVEDICKMPNSKLEKMLADMEETINYNFNWFYSREFVDLVFNELKLNLENAINSIN